LYDCCGSIACGGKLDLLTQATLQGAQEQIPTGTGTLHGQVTLATDAIKIQVVSLEILQIILEYEYEIEPVQV